MIKRELLQCPHCGNDGSDEDDWVKQSTAPFRLIENVSRTWEFDAVKLGATWLLDGDSGTDEVDWDSGDGLRLECCSCFGEFPIPEGFEVDFDRVREPAT
jgi:hypothetical protein